MHVFLKMNYWGTYQLMISEVERETKTLYVLKNGMRFRKVESSSTGVIGISFGHKYDRTHYLYSIDDKEAIEKHIIQCYREVEQHLKIQIKHRLEHLDYKKLQEINKCIN